MPRLRRLQSCSGYYHIMIRGINHQDIFLDDADRAKFRRTMYRFSEELDVEILSFCMMDNHVHLLLKAPDNLSAFMQKVSVSYVYYFNRKYDRIGHLFQDRYRSEIVETDQALLNVMRYILRNPQKAGISEMEKYRWSSWRENIEVLTAPSARLFQSIAGGQQSLLAFLRENSDESDESRMDLRTHRPLADSEASEILCAIGQIETPAKIRGLSSEERSSILKKAKSAGLSIRQLSRLTGMDRKTIQRM